MWGVVTEMTEVQFLMFSVGLLFLLLSGHAVHHTTLMLSDYWLLSYIPLTVWECIVKCCVEHLSISSFLELYTWTSQLYYRNRFYWLGCLRSLLFAVALLLFPFMGFHDTSVEFKKLLYLCCDCFLLCEIFSTNGNIFYNDTMQGSICPRAFLQHSYLELDLFSHF